MNSIIKAIAARSTAFTRVEDIEHRILSPGTEFFNRSKAARSSAPLHFHAVGFGFASLYEIARLPSVWLQSVQFLIANAMDRSKMR